MNAILVRIADIWATEPVVITGLVGAVLEALIAFGVQIDPQQKAAIMGLVGAAGVLVARSQVTPPAHLPVAPTFGVTVSGNPTSAGAKP